MSFSAESLMIREVLTVPPEMPLAELEDVLLDAGISAVPVVASGELLGVVSRSDIVKQASVARSIAGYIVDDGASRAMHEGRAPGEPESPTERRQREQILGERHADARVRDAMTDRAITVPPEASVQEVARVMATEKVHRVLVVRGRELLGVISAIDVVRLVADGRLR